MGRRIELAGNTSKMSESKHESLESRLIEYKYASICTYVRSEDRVF